MTDAPGPSVEENLHWDTAAAFTITGDTPWDILRAQLLWAIWYQRVEVAFREDNFHLGVILWQAWKNTIYCGMEAYKELFRHKRNEEKRQEIISCFQKVWTQSEIFGRMRGGNLKWNLTPHKDFLPEDLGAWNTPPIRIHRLSPSPDPEADFMARPDFPELIDAFIQGIHPQRQPNQTHQDNEASGSTPIAEPVPPGNEVTLEAPSTPPAAATQEVPQPAQGPRGSTSATSPHRNTRRPRSPDTQGHSRITEGNSSDLNREKENQLNIPVRKTSRQKRKCYRHKTPAAQSALCDISQRINTHNTTNNSHERETENTRDPPRSRAKRRCLFGPRKHHSHIPRLTSQEVRVSSPSRNTPSECSQGDVPHSPQNPHSLTHRSDPSVPGPPVNKEKTPPPQQQECPSVATYRVTLTLPQPSSRNPFDKYRGIPTPEPPPDPYRLIRRKLGLSEEAFEAHIEQDIEEMFQEIDNERRQALLETLPYEWPLTQADCRKLFRFGDPPSGSLRGVYRWAFDIEDEGSSTPHHNGDPPDQHPT